jgi:hypothetical protein
MAVASQLPPHLYPADPPSISFSLLPPVEKIVTSLEREEAAIREQMLVP